MEFVVGLAFVVVMLFMIYKWITLNDDYFAKRNIPALKSQFFLGNMFDYKLGRHNPVEFLTNVYNRFPNEK